MLLKSWGVNQTSIGPDGIGSDRIDKIRTGSDRINKAWIGCDLTDKTRIGSKTFESPYIPAKIVTCCYSVTVRMIPFLQGKIKKEAEDTIRKSA